MPLLKPLQELGDVSYLLSPQDLMALDHLPAMVAAGVSCFKIEGRLKGPEYVAATTAAYRAGDLPCLLLCGSPLHPARHTTACGACCRMHVCMCMLFCAHEKIDLFCSLAAAHDSLLGAGSGCR